MTEEAAYLLAAGKLREGARDKTKSPRTCFNNLFLSMPLSHKWIDR